MYCNCNTYWFAHSLNVKRWVTKAFSYECIAVNNSKKISDSKNIYYCLNNIGWHTWQVPHAVPVHDHVRPSPAESSWTQYHESASPPAERTCDGHRPWAGPECWRTGLRCCLAHGIFTHHVIIIFIISEWVSRVLFVSSYFRPGAYA